MTELYIYGWAQFIFIKFAIYLWSLTAGWGLLHSSGTIPNMLQKINLNSISFETCKTKYRKLGMDLLAGNLCTFTKIGEGACFVSFLLNPIEYWSKFIVNNDKIEYDRLQGDSGGPLTFDGKLVGVVHGGIPCARGYPDIFTEIAYYDRWIRDTININSRDLIWAKNAYESGNILNSSHWFEK